MPNDNQELKNNEITENVSLDVEHIDNTLGTEIPLPEDEPEDEPDDEPDDEPEDVDLHLNHNNKIDWFQQTEYIVFSNELKSMQRNNVIILKECKDNKRLLDLKYDDLNTIVNNIQTSVIFFSTLSGFIQATRIQFTMPDDISSIISITIATYIGLVLSSSKY